MHDFCSKFNIRINRIIEFHFKLYLLRFLNTTYDKILVYRKLDEYKF